MDLETEGEVIYIVDVPQQPQDAPSVIIEENMDAANAVEVVSTSEASENYLRSGALENYFLTDSCASLDEIKYHQCTDMYRSEGLVRTEDKRKKKRTGKKVVQLIPAEDDPASKRSEITKDNGENREEDSNAVQDRDKLTCELCNRKFKHHRFKVTHLRRTHKLLHSSSNVIKCLECNIIFCSVNGLRYHLDFKHNIEMVEHELMFPDMEAFQKWKREIERKTLSSYTLPHGSKGKGPFGPHRIYYCHRSGIYTLTRKLRLRSRESCKMGIMCTSTINLYTTPKQVHVRFCPNHYGHGKGTTFIQLSTEEQNAIEECVSQGMSYEKLLDEMRDVRSSTDYFQLNILKKKDTRTIHNTFSCDDFYSPMSDAESVSRWVSVCCQMESSPVLLYQKEDLTNYQKQQEKFMLIIMTEHQKHILQSSDKRVICIDAVAKIGKRFLLTVMYVKDEIGLAFPVAFCISKKLDQNGIATFYQALKEATGELSCQFLMSGYETFFYDMWKEVMNDNPRWLWNMWSMDSKFRGLLQRTYQNIPETVLKKEELYKTMRMLIECPNQTVFECMLKNFAENLKSDPDSKDLGSRIEQQYGTNAEMWAYCYRKEIDLATNIHLWNMHETFWYCCRAGGKTRLDKFIFVITKFVRDKMFERLCSLDDDDKLEIALTTINECHKLGVKTPKESITSLSHKTWLIQSEDEEGINYVTREFEKCPEMCNLKCGECDICVHMYICSCTHNLINANLCPHIHAIVWHLLTPHLTPPPSPVCTLGVTAVEEPEVESSFFSSIVEISHDVCEKIKANKKNLNTLALNSLKKHLCECIDICNGKLADDEEKRSLKKRRTENLSANFEPSNCDENDLRMTSSREMESIMLSEPPSSINCLQSFIFGENANFDGGGQVLVPNLVSASCTGKPMQVSNDMLVANNCYSSVISPAVSTTTSFDHVVKPYTASKTAVAKPPTISTTGYHPVAKTPTISTSCNQHSAVVLPVDSQPPIYIINSIQKTSRRKRETQMLSRPFPSVNDINFSIKVPKTASVARSGLQSVLIPSSLSSASTSATSVQVSNAMLGTNSHSVVIPPTVSAISSHLLEKPPTVSTTWNQHSVIVSSTVPLTSNSQNTKDSSSDFQHPIYIINSMPKISNGKSETLLLSGPFASINNSSSFTINRTASVAGSDQSILIPNTVSAATTSNTPMQVPNVMLGNNINRPFVPSSTVSTTSNSQKTKVSSASSQPPICVINSIPKTSCGKGDAHLLSGFFPSLNDSCSVRLPKTASIAGFNQSILIPNTGSTASISAAPTEVPNAIVNMNNNCPILRTPTVSTASSYHPVAKTPNISRTCNPCPVTLSSTESTTSSSEKTKDHPANFKPPIYDAIFSKQEGCREILESILLATPSLNDYQTSKLPKVASDAGRDQSILILSTAALANTSATPRHIPKAMQITNDNCQVVKPTPSINDSPSLTYPKIAYTAGRGRSILIPSNASTASTSATPMQVPRAMPVMNSNCAIVKPTPSINDSHSLLPSKIASIAGRCQSVLIPSTVSTASTATPMQVPRAMPVMNSNCAIVKPTPSINDSHSLLPPKIASIAGRGQSVLIPSTVSTASTATPMQVSKAMPIANNNCLVVKSSAEHATRPGLTVWNGNFYYCSKR